MHNINITNTDYYIIAILVYVFSFYYCWRWIHLAYTIGRFKILKPDYIDIILVVTPFLNLFFVLLFLTLLLVKERVTKTNYPSKFFKIYD